MNLDETFQILPHALNRNLDGQIVILDMSSGVYYGLDEVGARVWQLMSDGKSLAQIIDELLAEYSVERGELEQDILRLSEELITRNLIARTCHRSIARRR